MKTGRGGFMEAVGTTEENKMGTKPVWSLLMTMALPVVLSTAVQSLYNVVDGILVSQISEDAMVAITFANPLVTILIAVGSGIGEKEKAVGIVRCFYAFSKLEKVVIFDMFHYIISSTSQCKILQSLSIVFVSTFLFCRSLSS